MAIAVEQCAVGGYDKNFSCVVWDTTTGSAFVVDPAGDFAVTEAAINTHQLTVIGVLLTHTHFDHIEQLGKVFERYGSHVPVYVHEQGFEALSVARVEALREGLQIALGSHTLEVLHTPGHSPDSVCYFVSAEDSHNGAPLLISGDTLFVSKCGRTSQKWIGDLYNSLQRIKSLPADTIVYPGHDYGPTTTSTIAVEKAENRYLLCPDVESFAALRLL
jgi:hydroxyacylglutathione hydrolase